MKRTLIFLTVLTAFGALSLGASAAPRSATLVIQHVTHGCHSWALNGGKLQIGQHIHLARGGSLVIRNNDVMPHQLVKSAGPAIVLGAHGMMSHIGATAKVTFPAAGVYRLTTKAGEDYMQGVKTVGEDNVLRAIVTVS